MLYQLLVIKALPLALQQLLQWHSTVVCGAADSVYRTFAQRQLPVRLWAVIVSVDDIFSQGLAVKRVEERG